MRFYVGLHQPSDARHFERSFISVNRLRGARGRKSAFTAGDWIMDGRASRRSRGTAAVPKPVSVYAAEIRRWAGRGGLVATAAQDYMCEPYMLAKTGLAIADHQRLTVERYDALVTGDVGGVYIMPVLQGCKRSATFCGRPTAWLGRSLPESRAGVRMTGKRRRNSSGPSPRPGANEPALLT
jgi:hypothetical protein